MLAPPTMGAEIGISFVIRLGSRCAIAHAKEELSFVGAHFRYLTKDGSMIWLTISRDN
jgi:hypothetical protein